MKLVLSSEKTPLDKRFIEHLINYFPKLIFTKENIRKLKSVDEYLQTNIFTGKRKYSTNQIIRIILKNIKYKVNDRTAIIELDNAAVFPFYTFLVKDIAKLIDEGNLEIKGTHIFYNLYKYIETNIHKLRVAYEMGLL